MIVEPGRALSIAIEARVDALAAARERVRAFLQARDVDDAAIYATDLVLEELGGNTIRYGFDPGLPRSISIGVALTLATVTISIEDDGKPFDPTRHPEPERTCTLVQAPIGGRGISMVRRITRAMRYRRDGGWNRIEVDVARQPSIG